MTITASPSPAPAKLGMPPMMPMMPPMSSKPGVPDTPIRRLFSLFVPSGDLMD